MLRLPSQKTRILPDDLTRCSPESWPNMSDLTLRDGVFFLRQIWGDAEYARKQLEKFEKLDPRLADIVGNVALAEDAIYAAYQQLSDHVALQISRPRRTENVTQAHSSLDSEVDSASESEPEHLAVHRGMHMSAHLDTPTDVQVRTIDVKFEVHEPDKLPMAEDQKSFYGVPKD